MFPIEAKYWHVSDYWWDWASPQALFRFTFSFKKYQSHIVPRSIRRNFFEGKLENLSVQISHSQILKKKKESKMLWIYIFLLEKKLNFCIQVAFPWKWKFKRCRKWHIEWILPSSRFTLYTVMFTGMIFLGKYSLFCFASNISGVQFLLKIFKVSFVSNLCNLL